VQTKKDRLTIAFSPDELMAAVREFVSLTPEDARERFDLGADGSDWKVELAQKDVRLSGLDEGRATPILYRPFDMRWTYYTGRTRGFLGRPRREVMQHMLAGPNCALICMRQAMGGAYTYAGVTRHINCHGTFYLGNRGQDYLMPLYVYPPEELQAKAFDLTSPWPEGPHGRRPNLNEKLVVAMAERVGLEFVSDGSGNLTKTFGPEDVLHYIFGILSLPWYRSHYGELLPRDFPRIPLTTSRDTFASVTRYGAELAALHLLEHPALNRPRTKYPVAGSDQVADGYPQYVPPGSSMNGEMLKDGRIYINDKQYVDGVSPAVWEFELGGYEVCEKWLDYRRGRKLSFDDLSQLQRFLSAIHEILRATDEDGSAVESVQVD
jgi:hypothetical protein